MINKLMNHIKFLLNVFLVKLLIKKAIKNGMQEEDIKILESIGIIVVRNKE